VCERIPYLILPVRQLSRKPFGIRQSAASEPSGKTPGLSHRTTRRSDTRASRRASRRLPPRTTRRSDTSEPSGKMPGPPRTIRRSATSEPSGNTPGPSRSEPSAEAIHERSVEQAVAAEPRAIRRSSHSQRALLISNRTP